MRDQIDYLINWMRAHTPHRDEGGFTAVEWMFVVIGVIAIATIAVTAVKAYMNGQVGKLGSP